MTDTGPFCKPDSERIWFEDEERSLVVLEGAHLLQLLFHPSPTLKGNLYHFCQFVACHLAMREEGTCQLCGTTGMVLFRRGQPPQEMGPSADLSFLVD